MANQKAQEQPVHSEKSFDWRSVSNDMKAMRDNLLDADKYEAATLCDNAYRMMVRLWTITDEAKFSLTCAQSALERGDIEQCKESLNNVEHNLNVPTTMKPEKLMKSGLAQSVRAIAFCIRSNGIEFGDEKSEACDYANEVITRIENGDYSSDLELVNIKQRLQGLEGVLA